MSKPLSAKKKIKIALLLGGLSLVAIWTNSDILFGKPLEPLKGNNNAPAAETPVIVEIRRAGSVPANALEGRGATQADGKTRNPFITGKEEDPFGEIVDPLTGDSKDPEMPPSMRAQAIMIYGKNQKIASIEGRQVKEGESFYGGRIALIEASHVTVKFKGGTTWIIPFGAGPAAIENR